jgi:hypothetical protein
MPALRDLRNVLEWCSRRKRAPMQNFITYHTPEAIATKVWLSLWRIGRIPLVASPTFVALRMQCDETS